MDMSTAMRTYIEIQDRRWLAHCLRMENSALQKKTLFMMRTCNRKNDKWKTPEEKT